ncbi:glucan endo-1,3-beta-glucosidase-like isoform X2 [Tasmannia lanceolata]
MWLPKPNFEVLEALTSTQIKVTISVPNSDLRALATNPATANSWVKKHIFEYWPSVKFQYICVGNEALTTKDSDHLLPAMKNIDDAIQAKPTTMNKIKVSTTVGLLDLDAYNPNKPPSTCFFNENVKDNLVPILQFLASKETPLFVNIFPYPVWLKNVLTPLPHFLFTAMTTLVTDGKYEYKYVFDSMVDGFYCALEALSVRDVKIIVAATGWPRLEGPLLDGNDISNAQSVGKPNCFLFKGLNLSIVNMNAQLYNSNLVKHVQTGTPRWPRRLETYILSMYDENLKSGKESEKSYGVFDKAGEPLYPFP